jgi:hypothetical protein
MPDWLSLIVDVGAVGFVIASGALLRGAGVVDWLRRRQERRRRDQP